CKIKALRAKTNTYIKTPVRGEEPVFVVTGRKEDVGMAKREILSAAEHFSQIRACRKNNLNGSMAPGPPTNVPGQVTIQVRVPYRVVGLVVGPKGATIKRIQQQTHTYIVTPSRDKEPVFEVTGLPESVEQARKEIEAHIAMRTGGLLDQDEPNAATAAAVAAVAARHHGDFPPPSHGLDNLFSPSPSELVSSLYKLNNSSLNGLASINSITSGAGLNGLTNGLSSGLSNGSSLNGINGLNGLSGSGLNNTLSGMNGLNNPLNNLNTLNQLNDLNSAFTLLGDAGSSLLGSGSKSSGSTLDASLFSSFSSGVAGSKLGNDVTGGGSSGLGLYGVDEGLGSLGSSMGSSPSFDPAPSGIWSELGRSLGNTMSSTVSSSSSLSSTFSSLSSTLSSSLTRRSSSVSGASPPSSRLSPSLEPHPPARRISSDPAPGLAAGSMATLSSALSVGLGGLPTSSPSSSSPASTPDLSHQLNSFQCGSGLPPAPATSTSTTTIASMNQLACSLDEKKRCVTCCESEVVAALVPCGHNLFCLDCANKLVSEAAECPICRMKVTQAIRIFS
ncbi:Zinc ion binding, partial [Halocaridina rubra]